MAYLPPQQLCLQLRGETKVRTADRFQVTLPCNARTEFGAEIPKTAEPIQWLQEVCVGGWDRAETSLP